jgi:hypothetical protein
MTKSQLRHIIFEAVKKSLKKQKLNMKRNELKQLIREVIKEFAPHDEIDLNNPEEAKEVELAIQIKALADEILGMHGTNGKDSVESKEIDGEETDTEESEKKLNEELVKPLATDTTDDSGELPDEQLGNKPNPRLDALTKKKLDLTTRVSTAKGTIAAIKQRTMSQTQRAERTTADAERRLKIVNTDLERETKKMQETKLKLKTLIKKILNEMR